jgi:hypothetical protein
MSNGSNFIEFAAIRSHARRGPLASCFSAPCGKRPARRPDPIDIVYRQGTENAVFAASGD